MNMPMARMAVKKMFNAAPQHSDLTALQQDISNYLIDAGPEGMTTRQIADSCNTSIYSARNWLLKLEDENLVRKEKCIKGYKWLFNFPG